MWNRKGNSFLFARLNHATGCVCAVFGRIVYLSGTQQPFREFCSGTSPCWNHLLNLPKLSWSCKAKRITSVSSILLSSANFLFKFLILLLKITIRIMLHVSAYVINNTRVLRTVSPLQLNAQGINHWSNLDLQGLNAYFVIILTLRSGTIVVPGHFQLRDGCHVRALNLE